MEQDIKNNIENEIENKEQSQDIKHLGNPKNTLEIIKK